MDKLTPWFPSHIKPVHKGWYHVKFDVESSRNIWWDGSFWSLYRRGDASFLQDWEWRGIMKGNNNG